MTILSVEGLTKIYGSGDTAVTALDHVSFTVEKGRICRHRRRVRQRKNRRS